jgi:hypothetical protein
MRTTMQSQPPRLTGSLCTMNHRGHGITEKTALSGLWSVSSVVVQTGDPGPIKNPLRKTR